MQWWGELNGMHRPTPLPGAESTALGAGSGCSIVIALLLIVSTVCLFSFGLT